MSRRAVTETAQTEAARGPLWGRTPASQQRRRDILLAGKKVFFKEGYQLASVDRIAEVAGTTKRTVYDHFGSKDLLFAEVMAFAGNQFVALLPSADDLPENPADGMRAFATRFVEIVSAPDSLRFQRLVIAEAQRQPAMGRALYESAVLGAEKVLARGGEGRGEWVFQDEALCPTPPHPSPLPRRREGIRISSDTQYDNPAPPWLPKR